jgi:[ribosomal protein S5]-alanine N-acetyltransferase
MTSELRLETSRLVLRPWTQEDAPALQQLAGQREIADTMISVPHPFTEEHARSWIAGHAEAFTQRRAIHFAIELRDPSHLIGAIELRTLDSEHNHGEVSLWIGVPWWGQGFAAEAAGAVLAHGFEVLELNRIYAFHMVRNPSSGTVLGNIGMRREGLLRQCVRKWGRYEDVVIMAALRSDWVADRARRP